MMNSLNGVLIPPIQILESTNQWSSLLYYSLQMNSMEFLTPPIKQFGVLTSPIENNMLQWSLRLPKLF